MALDINLATSGADLRVLTTKEAPEGFGRGLPMGPSSVRFNDGSLWAVDSIAGRFVEFDSAGKEQKSIGVKDASKLVLADFVFEKSVDDKTVAIWAVGSEQADILKIDLEGNVLASFSTGLSIPGQLELLPQKQFVILDQGQSVFAAFDESGKKLWQQECLGKGFITEASGDILFISKKGETAVLARRINTTGQVVDLFEMPVGIDANPSLLIGQSKDEIVFSFHSLAEETGEYAYNISRISLDGKPMASMTTTFPAAFINRVIVSDGQKLLFVSFVEENSTYILRLSDFAPTMIEEASQG